MDPMFVPYSQVNGVPQESKLAQYMKRQSEAPSSPVTSSISKNLSALTLNDNLNLPLKKVVPATEFVPRNAGSPLTTGTFDSPTPPLTNPSPTPQATYQGDMYVAALVAKNNRAVLVQHDQDSARKSGWK